MARRLIADWDNAEDEMRQRFSLQRGRVTLAAMPSFAGNLLPPILKTFRARYPNVNVTVNDVINEQVLEMVRDRQVELGVAFEPMQNTSMTFTPLYMDRFVAVVPQDSPLAARTEIDWKTLLQEPFITLQRPSTVRVMLEEHLLARGMKCRLSLKAINWRQWGGWFPVLALALCQRCVPSRCRNWVRALPIE